jgi:hypothetical protein
MRTKPGIDDMFLTLPIAARKIGIPVSLLRIWVENCLIPTYKFSSTIKLLNDDVVKFIEEMKSGNLPDMGHLPKQFRVTYNSSVRISKKNNILCPKGTRISFSDRFENRKL